MKHWFVLAHAEARRRAEECVRNAPDGYTVVVKEPARTLDQNAAQWPILQCFSDQLLWPVNGALVKLEPEEWKTILTAAYRNESVRVALGLNGGMVLLGMRTSKMSKKEFSDYLEFLNATAVERGVNL